MTRTKSLSPGSSQRSMATESYGTSTVLSTCRATTTECRVQSSVFVQYKYGILYLQVPVYKVTEEKKY